MGKLAKLKRENQLLRELIGRFNLEVEQTKKRTAAVRSLETVRMSKKRLAAELGVSRSSLYYKRKIPDKDEELKSETQRVLHLHPSYGYRRLAIELRINGKRVRRVMRLFGIKPYRRRERKPKYHKTTDILPYSRNTQDESETIY